MSCRRAVSLGVLTWGQISIWRRATRGRYGHVIFGHCSRLGADPFGRNPRAHGAPGGPPTPPPPAGRRNAAVGKSGIGRHARGSVCRLCRPPWGTPPPRPQAVLPSSEGRRAPGNQPSSPGRVPPSALPSSPPRPGSTAGDRPALQPHQLTLPRSLCGHSSGCPGDSAGARPRR